MEGIAHATSTPLLLALAVCASLSVSGSGSARASEGAPEPGSSAPSIAELQAELEAVDANPKLEEPAKAPLRRAYEQAIEALRSAEAFADRAGEYREILESGAPQAEALRAERQALGDVDEAAAIDRSLGTGWIAAALSVGLGFGLQEVVANFICGLILLFERPIRVGDIVTVEGTTGTVSRIQMRATTIVNWDRQEFVVPNKTLITSTLLNWTLSESMNRVVIPVGVAYGSDTDRAMEILLEVATDNPRILNDPKPFATFEKFGESSLDLVLRGFLENVESRLTAITELHSEINRRFADAGIEIAFPQRDLHLRTGWKHLRDAVASDEKERTIVPARPSRAESEVHARDRSTRPESRRRP